MRSAFSLLVSSLLFVLLVSGCSAVPRPQSHIRTADLLDGHALFGETVATEEAGDVDMLALSPAMSDFLRQNVRSPAADHMRSRSCFEA